VYMTCFCHIFGIFINTHVIPYGEQDMGGKELTDRTTIQMSKELSANLGILAIHLHRSKAGQVEFMTRQAMTALGLTWKNYKTAAKVLERLEEGVAR